MPGPANPRDRIVSGDSRLATAPRFVFPLIISLLCLSAVVLPTIAVAQEEEPAWDRKIQGINILPAREPGRFDLYIAYTVAAQPSSVPLDLSTDVLFLLNGSLLAAPTHEEIEFFPYHPPCEFSQGCGGSCGDANLNGANFGLICFEDCPGHFDPNLPIDCDCGAWITADLPGVELQPGDEIMVILDPAPGALPDPEPSNDEIRSVFHGGPIYWNRRVRSVDVTRDPNAPPDTYEVSVAGDVSFDGQQAMILDMVVSIEINGIAVAEELVSKRAVQHGDITCFQLGCGSYCGVIDNIERNCDPIMFNGCGCGAGWLQFFPGVHIPDLQPGDEIAVILRPAEGVLPEFWAIDDRIVWQAPVSGVGPAGSPTAIRLEQNQPNPFNPQTTIRFALDRADAVRIGVFAADGRKIRSLIDRSFDAGLWSITWDGLTDAGQAAAAGTYFCRMTTGAREETRKMHLLR